MYNSMIQLGLSLIWCLCRDYNNLCKIRVFWFSCWQKQFLRPSLFAQARLCYPLSSYPFWSTQIFKCLNLLDMVRIVLVLFRVDAAQSRALLVLTRRGRLPWTTNTMWFHWKVISTPDSARRLWLFPFNFMVRCSVVSHFVQACFQIYNSSLTVVLKLAAAKKVTCVIHAMRICLQHFSKSNKSSSLAGSGINIAVCYLVHSLNGV